MCDTRCNTRQHSKKLQKKRDRVMVVVTISTLILAYFIGLTRAKVNMEPYLSEAISYSNNYEKIDPKTYVAYANETKDTTVGYITLSEANGFGGPMKVVVGVDTAGTVLGLSIIEHRETPSWFKKVMANDFPRIFHQKKYDDEFEFGADLDGIAGATYTSKAIMDATRTGSRYLASNYLDLAVPIEEKEEIQFGLPEIMLIALFVIGFVGRKRSFKFKKQIRWISMIAGMVVLGILFNRPINLVYINKFLLGFWPDWRIHLYWYLLIGGVILVFALRKKNIYCQWFCPLGAAQECIGAIGGAKNASFVKHHQYLEWLKRSIVWTAIMIAFIFRNPSLSNYEISGTLFTLTGSNIQFLLLAAVLFAALFIKRAWCVYLCPISSVEQFVSTLRVWGTESWKKIKV